MNSTQAFKVLCDLILFFKPTNSPTRDIEILLHSLPSLNLNQFHS